VIKKSGSFLLCVLVLTALVFVSCDSFFSTSWGSERDYDPSKIDLTIKNLDSWIQKSIGNPKLAAALTEKIVKKIEANPDPWNQDTATYQEKGVKLVIEASGIGTSILSNAADVFSDIENLKGDEAEQAVKDILSNVQDDFSSGGPQAAENLTKIINGNITDPTGTPELTGIYARDASPGDVGQAVLVLALGILDDINGDFDKLKSGTDSIAGIKLNTSDKRFFCAGSETTSQSIALAAYLNLIAGGGKKFENNPVTKALKDALDLD
jgi:hypothetical protein